MASTVATDRSDEGAPAAPVRRALLSVSDKRGLTAFAAALTELGVELLSTGGTARALRDAGLQVTEVSDYTGFPELMDGRVKTLHPRVHAGILARRGHDTDRAALAEHDIAPIDLVLVNLYPFERTVAGGGDFATVIENIDIGGPSMLRAAAKNHADVTVLVEPDDYAAVLAALRAQGGVPAALRRRLAARAFAHSARYEAAISGWLQAQVDQPSAPAPADDDAAAWPPTLQLELQRVQALRYGENPHQRAAWYRPPGAAAGLAAAELVQGKALSYNNLMDADAARACVLDLQAPACVIVKHANPCGVAVAEDIEAAYRRAFATDPTSAFGGIIAFNRPLDAATARTLLDNQFVEVIWAPAAAAEVAPVLAQKPNVRVLIGGADAPPAPELRPLAAGWLLQDADRGEPAPHGFEVVTARAPDAAELADLEFLWRVARHVKSNAIVVGRDGATVGIGAGQMSRVDSTRLAVQKAALAGLDVAGCALASDAFFPFADGVEQAAEAGVRALVQPGGSRRDAEVIAAADAHGMAMVFTGTRHFRH